MTLDGAALASLDVLADLDVLAALDLAALAALDLAALDVAVLDVLVALAIPMESPQIVTQFLGPAFTQEVPPVMRSSKQCIHHPALSMARLES